MSRRLCLFLLFAGLMVFVGADWQTEIAAINVANGWEFAWPLCFPWPSNWAAFDFWRLVRYGVVAVLAVFAFEGVLRRAKA